MKVFMFLITVMLLSSCGKHSDGTSVWAGGLLIIPLVTGIGAAFFFILSYLSSKSNSTTADPHEHKINDNTGNVPIYKNGRFWFGVALAIATIVIILIVNSEK